MIPFPVVACFLLTQAPRDERFLVAWKPEADAPFYAIRMKIEPYAYRSDVDVNWMRRQAIDAYSKWKDSPKDARALFRAFLWQQVLLAAHHNADRLEDGRARQTLKSAVYKLERVPPSAEFSRLVCSAQYGSEALHVLTLRLLDRYPGDGLLLHWVQPNLLRFVPERRIKPIQNLASMFVKKHPDFWAARYTWAVSAWMVKEDTSLAEEYPALKEMRSRFLELKGDSRLGVEERKDVDFWLERLNRYIPGYEEIIKKGKGHLKARTYRGDPP